MVCFVVPQSLAAHIPEVCLSLWHSCRIELFHRSQMKVCHNPAHPLPSRPNAGAFLSFSPTLCPLALRKPGRHRYDKPLLRTSSLDPHPPSTSTLPQLAPTISPSFRHSFGGSTFPTSRPCDSAHLKCSSFFASKATLFVMLTC